MVRSGRAVAREENCRRVPIELNFCCITRYLEKADSEIVAIDILVCELLDVGVKHDLVVYWRFRSSIQYVLAFFTIRYRVRQRSSGSTLPPRRVRGVAILIRWVILKVIGVIRVSTPRMRARFQPAPVFKAPPPRERGGGTRRRSPSTPPRLRPRDARDSSRDAERNARARRAFTDFRATS